MRVGVGFDGWFEVFGFGVGLGVGVETGAQFARGKAVIPNSRVSKLQKMLVYIDCTGNLLFNHTFLLLVHNVFCFFSFGQTLFFSGILGLCVCAGCVLPLPCLAPASEIWRRDPAPRRAPETRHWRSMCSTPSPREGRSFCMRSCGI